MDYDKIPSGINSKEESINSLMEAASAEARRISRTIQEIARTKACKGVQVNGRNRWAIINNCWIDSNDVLGTFSDRGSENEVYTDSTNELLLYLQQN